MSIFTPSARAVAAYASFVAVAVVHPSRARSAIVISKDIRRVLSVPYTRIHEFKHYHPEDAAVMNAEKTIVMREYSATWKEGDEPYYPVDNADSRALHARYKAEAGKIPHLVVGGRLGGYKYYDMDESIEAALKVCL